MPPIPVTTNAKTLAGVTPSTAGLALLDDADAAAQRSTLGLGSIATQAADNVLISGGLIHAVPLCTVSMPVDAATVIAVGDLLFYDASTLAMRASDMPDQGTEAANQQLFHDFFAGVALDAHSAGVATTIRVATMGVFVFSCLSTTMEIGFLIGPDEDAGGTFLQNQTVAKVTNANAAVGRAVSRGASQTSVSVAIVSSMVWGGVYNIL